MKGLVKLSAEVNIEILYRYCRISLVAWQDAVKLSLKDRYADFLQTARIILRLKSAAPCIQNPTLELKAFCLTVKDPSQD